MGDTPPLQQCGTWKTEKKKLQKGDPKHFGLIKGGAEGFFHV